MTDTTTNLNAAADAYNTATDDKAKDTAFVAVCDWLYKSYEEEDRYTDAQIDAMDIESGVFKSGSAEAIARSLKESSLHSRRRKGTPFQSAMSMLNFYINRAGRNLPKSRRDTLVKAKGKLREAFGRKP